MLRAATSGSVSPVRTSSISACIWSRPCSNAAAIGSVTCSCPLRRPSSRVSTSCVNDTTASQPNSPAVPLMVCAARNAAFRLSASSGVDSITSSAASNWCSMSTASSRKPARAAAMISASSRVLMLGLHRG
jgi:hypothetical protein